MTGIRLSYRLVAASALFAAIFLLQKVGQAEAACCTSHYESYTYYVTVSSYNCYPYTYTYCYNWWYYNYWWWGWRWYYPYYWGYYWNPWYGWGWWNWCYQRTSYNCYNTYRTEARTGQKCVDGWVGTNCNIPTCNPNCDRGMICSDLNKCTCAGSGGGTASCQIVPCSPTNNCYPGTCESSTCKCPPGFNGDNCEKILHSPTITTCGVSLTGMASPSAPPTQVLQASCAAPGESPIVVWVNAAGLNMDSDGYGLNALQVAWTSSYTYPLTMPERPDGASSFFIKNAPVAIYLSDAEFILTFPDNNTADFTRQKQCNLPDGTPTQHVCSFNEPWADLNVNHLIGHNKTVIVKMTASLGGSKKGDETYSYNNQSYGFGEQKFQGIPITYSAAFKFDLVRPTHCLLYERDLRLCTAYPIYLDSDVRSDPAISPKLNGWEDDGSGIKTFHFQVFFMQPDAYGILSPTGNAYSDSIASLSPADAGNYHFTVPAPGVYSIIVTAYDHGNNSAQARKIFNYINSASYTIDSTQPVYLQESNPSVNYSFITKLTNPQRVNLIWNGRFKPTEQWRTVFSARVNPLGAPNGYTIDDNYGTQFGQRSLAAHVNKTGISSYTVRWYIDHDNGGVYAQPEMADNTTTMTVSTESASIALDEPLTSGSTIVVWLTATGVTSDNTTYKIVTHVDTSPPNVTDTQFTKNGGIDGFSRLTFTVVDTQSGINATNYTVVDLLNNNNVIIPPTWSLPSIREAPTSKKRKRDIQQPCTPSDITCFCTPFETCYNYVQNIDIDNCKLDRYTDRESFQLQLQYWVSNLAGTATMKGTIDLGDISGVQCRAVLSGGAITGIVIGCVLGVLLLICLIGFIVLIITRIRDHKRPVPNRHELRSYAGVMRNKFTIRRERSETNEVYGGVNPLAADESKISKQHNNMAYVDSAGDRSNVYDSDSDKFKISQKQVQFGEKLAEGRFATIRCGHYMKANDKTPVAIKSLKRGFSERDELLMAEKVTFMKNAPRHNNLVVFHGFIDELNGQGQMMILELCDIPLTNWLESLPNVTDIELDQMLIIALNIAQGVQHLHNHKILHRRLAARNVLLKKKDNGDFVAKLIGYGPTPEDLNDRDAAGTRTGVGLPLKWMAPETIDTSKTRNPTYNEKTDAWSYGVTVWEIYSKGASPYKDEKSTDIVSFLRTGQRLQRPPDCPEYLYNEVMKRCWADAPAQRPSFHTIQERIHSFRTETMDQQAGYYALHEGGRADEQAGYYVLNQDGCSGSTYDNIK